MLKIGNWRVYLVRLPAEIPGYDTWQYRANRLYLGKWLLYWTNKRR